MAIKFKQSFAKTGMALALAAAAGLAQAAVSIEDVTAEHTLKKNDLDKYEFIGTFPEPTGDSSDGYTFGVEIEGVCTSNRPEPDVGTLSIVGNQYTLLLDDRDEITLALEEFDPGVRYPLPSFTYCATNNTDQTVDKAQMTWNLRIPGTEKDVMQISVAKNADSSALNVDLYNAHTEIEATGVDLVVDMGVITCDTASATVNGADVPSTDIQCGPNLTAGVGVDAVSIANGMIISTSTSLAQGETVHFTVNYPQTTETTPWNFNIYALAAFNGGDGVAKNTMSGSAIVAPDYEVDVDNATETVPPCQDDEYSCDDDGVDGNDIKIELGETQELSAGSQITLTLSYDDSDEYNKDTRPFECSASPRIVNGENTALIPLSDVQCFENRMTVTLANGLAAGAELQLNTTENDCSAHSCDVDYELFLYDVDTNSRVKVSDEFEVFHESHEDDSLAALIAFMSLLASIWYFRREKALKAA